MKLKLTYQNKEDLPEGAVQFYTEQEDGSYSLNLDGSVKTQKDVDKVKAALDAEREKRVDLQKKVDEIPEDFNAEKWDSVKHLDPDEIPDASKITERINAEADKWKSKVDKAESEKKQLQEKFKNTLIEKELTESLVEAGVDNKVRLEDAVTRIRKKHSPDLEETDGKFKVVVGSLKEELPAFVKDWASSDEGKYYVSAPDNSGGGSNNQGGGGEKKVNPYKKESWNLTQQARLESENIDEAKRMAAAAGVDINAV